MISSFKITCQPRGIYDKTPTMVGCTFRCLLQIVNATRNTYRTKKISSKISSENQYIYLFSLLGNETTIEDSCVVLKNQQKIIIEKEIEVEMKAELYSFLLENKFKNGVMYIKSMHEFVVKYDMAESVEEESLMRGFQRWRKKMKV